MVELQRARPEFLTLFKKPRIRFSDQTDRNRSGPSFPSGHTTNNTVIAVCCTIFFRRRGWFYWIVAANIVFPPGTGILIAGVAGSSHLIFRNGADAVNQLSLFNPTVKQGAANFTVGAARLVQAGFTNSTADFLKIGGSNATGTNTGNNSAASMRLGSWGGAGFASSKIAEVLITNGIPSAGDRATLEAYSVGLYGAGVTA
jgi:hypothetical protein